MDEIPFEKNAYLAICSVVCAVRLVTAWICFPLGSVHTIMVILDESGIVHMPGNTPYILELAMLGLGGTAAFFGFDAFLSMI